MANRIIPILTALLALVACGGESPQASGTQPDPQAGSPSTAGQAGQVSHAGKQSTGGSGGQAPSGGQAGSGSEAGTTAGGQAPGGSPSTGGQGGTPQTGGSLPTGGNLPTGGTLPTGGSPATGGTVEPVTCQGSPVGTLRCTGRNQEVCGADGSWAVKEACGSVCQADACTGECVPEATRCNGTTQESCTGWGTWTANQACPYVCSSGACTGVCVPGQTRCTGLQVESCGATGQWVKAETCGFVCQAGACQGSCTPGSKRCSGQQAETCGADGSWVQDQTCPYVCSAGACTGVCSPGQTRCNGATTETCGATGQWALTKTCGVAANQNATCSMVAGQATCGVSCKAGYDDCDGQAANGCEANLLIGIPFGADPTKVLPTTCGACGHACTAPQYQYPESSPGVPGKLVGGCQAGVCTDSYCFDPNQTNSGSGVVTGYTVTADDQIWSIADYASLWYMPSPTSVTRTLKASSAGGSWNNDVLENPGRPGSFCWTTSNNGSKTLACLSDTGVVDDTILTRNASRGEVSLQASRILISGYVTAPKYSRPIQEITRGSSTVLQVSPASTYATGPVATSPGFNYYTVLSDDNTLTLYQSAAGSTARSAIKSWAGQTLTDLQYRNGYLVWVRNNASVYEVGSYNTVTGAISTLVPPSLAQINGLTLDDTWAYYGYGPSISRVALTGGATETRVAFKETPPNTVTLKSSNKYLYWRRDGLVCYQAK